MLEGVLGNATAEKTLLYLEAYEEAHAPGIADTFGLASVTMARRQLERFERAGLLVSVTKGRTRLFSWNQRYAFLAEIRALLQKALNALPEAERRRYFTERRRPRRTGKPR